MITVEKKIMIFLIAFSASVISIADNNVMKDLSESLPDLISIIEKRKQQYQEKLNGDGMSFSGGNDASSAHPEPTTDRIQHDDIVADDHHAFQHGLRDPFAITRAVADASQDHAGHASRPAFQTLSSGQHLPEMKLRGILLKENKDSPLALLEVKGDEVYLVRAGDEISFNPAQANQVIKIKHIDRLSLIVEVGTLGDIIVVR